MCSHWLLLFWAHYSWSGNIHTGLWSDSLPPSGVLPQILDLCWHFLLKFNLLWLRQLSNASRSKFFPCFLQIVTTSTNLALCLLVFPSMRSRPRITSSFSPFISHIFLAWDPLPRWDPSPPFPSRNRFTEDIPASSPAPKPKNWNFFPAYHPGHPKEGVCRAGQVKNETRAGRRQPSGVGGG